MKNLNINNDTGIPQEKQNILWEYHSEYEQMKECLGTQFY